MSIISIKLKQWQSDTNLKFTFLKIRSFREKVKYIENEEYMSSDILCFTETWLHEEEDPVLNNYNCLSISNGKGTGVMFCMKKTMTYPKVFVKKC